MDQLGLWASGRSHDVACEDLAADPVGTAEAVYRHSGLPLPGAAAKAMRAHAAASAASRAGPATGTRWRTSA